MLIFCDGAPVSASRAAARLERRRRALQQAPGVPAGSAPSSKPSCLPGDTRRRLSL